jgi:hypothetical protein
MILPDINSIKMIYPTDGIPESLPTINNNYSTLHLWISAIEQEYEGKWQPIIDYYNRYMIQLQNSLTLAQSYSANWDSFQTTVETNSSKWLQPFTIVYPTLIQDNITQDDVDAIKNWLDQYFPIRNSNGSLNYVENQKFIVSCYLYTYNTGNEIDILDQPYSYAICTTNSGTIYAHCQIKYSGGNVHCNQSTYSCNLTFDFYPSKHVDCWFTSPYLYNNSKFGSAINDSSVFDVSKQTARGQIQANLRMKYNDRKETQIQHLIFTVNECDWNYGGIL